MPFCRVIRPTNSTNGTSGSNAVPAPSTPGSGRGRYCCRSIPLWITRTGRSDAVERLHVVLHRLRHRDHAVGVLVGGPLDPARGVIGGAELLDLPRPVRLERMRRQHQRDVLELLHQAAGEMRVPGVAVDDVEIRRHAGSSPGPASACRTACCAADPAPGSWPEAARRRRPASPTARPDRRSEHAHEVPPVVQRRELAGQVFDVNAGSPVDVRGVLVRQDADSHLRMIASVPGAGCTGTSHFRRR